MIKELMIGNAVNYLYEAYEIWSIANNSTATSEHYYVDLDSKSADKHLKGIDVSLISPIPLTEDILIRCGFEKKFDIVYEERHYTFGESNLLVFNPRTTIWTFNGVELINQPKSLHTLQNLVKLLCNQTIELK